jgi:hypothetical protein
MIEILTDLPGNVIAFRATGRVSAALILFISPARITGIIFYNLIKHCYRN